MQSSCFKLTGYISRTLYFKTLRVKLSWYFSEVDIKLCQEDMRGIDKLAGCEYWLWKAFAD